MAIMLCFIAKYTLAIWRHPIAKCTLAIWQQPIESIHWRFWRPLIALTETIELVAFIRLEGVNYVFSRVSLILVATFIS